jgi:hypothetical protein
MARRILVPHGRDRLANYVYLALRALIIADRLRRRFRRDRYLRR